MPEYVSILVLLFLLAFFLHRQYRLKIFRSGKHLIVVWIIFVVVGTVWDHYAIARGHWFFGTEYLLGPKIGLMPIEEFGFILIVPYFCFVIYKLVEKKLLK